MKNLHQIIKLKLNEIAEEKEGGYMFIQDIQTMHGQLSKIIKLMQDEKMQQAVRDMMQEHEWAVNHLATSKDDIEEVFNFIMNSANDYETVNRYEDEDFIKRDAGLPQEFSEEKMKGEDPCWDGYEMVGKKMKNGKEVPNCVPIKESVFIYEDEDGSVEETDFITDDLLNEAEYQGRKVKLGKIMQGDIKKFKVYVKNDKGKVVKVNFGFGGKSAKGKRMVIKKDNPERRKSFRARHNCENPGPRWKPRYWACKTW